MSFAYVPRCDDTSWRRRATSTYPATTTRHGDDGLPLVDVGIEALGAAELCRVVAAAHRVDHVVVDGDAQVLAPRAHRRHAAPAVGARVVALDCDTHRATGHVQTLPTMPRPRKHSELHALEKNSSRHSKMR